MPDSDLTFTGQSRLGAIHNYQYFYISIFFSRKCGWVDIENQNFLNLDLKAVSTYSPSPVAVGLQCFFQNFIILSIEPIL